MNAHASTEAARLALELAAMADCEVWSSKLGIGSFLAVDLGGQVEERRVLGGREHTRLVGEWRLWIQFAAWRLEDTTQVLVGCEDPRPVIAEQVAVLRGRRLTALHVKEPALETVFDFGGVRLLVFPVHSVAAPDGSAQAQWSLWRPQGDIVTVRPGRGRAWSIEPSTARGAPSE